MKLNLSIIISFIVLIIGIIFSQSYLWIPLSVLIAGFIDILTRNWVLSNKLGSATSISTIIKSLFALIGFYAMIGQVVCIVLIVFWII